MKKQKRQALFFFLGYISILLIVSGCGIFQKRSYDFRTTGLFIKQQDENCAHMNIEDIREECVDLDTMIQRFLSIQERDEENGIVGDTKKEVEQKGFSLFYSPDPLHPKKRRRRPNTVPLHGSNALAEAGMGVSQPPLQTPEEIERYQTLMSSYYGAIFIETGLKTKSDYICLNKRNSLEEGYTYTFVIVWQGNHVVKRIIKDGPVYNPRQEEAIFLCVKDMVTGAASTAVRGATSGFAP